MNGVHSRPGNGRRRPDAPRHGRTRLRPRRPAREVSPGARQAPADRRQRAVHRGQGRLQALHRRPLHRSADRPWAADRRGRRAGDRGRLRRPPGGGAAARSRRREDPHPRERRRLRRHLVLEPLSGRPVRHRELHLPAAAGRDRLHPQGEVQLRPGDPRPFAPDRRALRPLPRRLLPDRDPRHHLARGREALAGLDQPRRRVQGSLCGDVERAAEPAEAARPARDRALQRPLVPHQPLGLRLHRRELLREPGQAGRQEDRHHRHRRHGDPVRAAPRQGGRAALRVPAHALVGRPARQPPDRSRLGCLARARLAEAPDGELQHPGLRWDAGRGSGQRRLDRHHPQPDVAGRRARRQADVHGTAGRDDGAGRLPQDEPGPQPGGRDACPATPRPPRR